MCPYNIGLRYNQRSRKPTIQHQAWQGNEHEQATEGYDVLDDLALRLRGCLTPFRIPPTPPHTPGLTCGQAVLCRRDAYRVGGESLGKNGGQHVFHDFTTQHDARLMRCQGGGSDIKIEFRTEANTSWRQMWHGREVTVPLMVCESLSRPPHPRRDISAAVGHSRRLRRL